jgi:transposase
MGTDLSGAQWERIQPLLPVAKPTGRPRADDRRTINGILYVLRTACR